MPARFRRKIVRQRGKRWHGYGAKKKHRGAGSRGGRGKAGWLKHKKSFMLKYYPDHFGRRGFKIPIKAKKTENAITLGQINEIASKKNMDKINVKEFGFQKVLGSGKLSRQLTIISKKITEKAKNKIDKVGGKYESD